MINPSPIDEKNKRAGIKFEILLDELFLASNLKNGRTKTIRARAVVVKQAN
jgi:hypothetical protein